MHNKEVYIIIPTHNRKEMLRACLLSLAGQTFKGFHIIVVDDGSSDGTSQMLSAEFKDVIVIQGDGNLWWTGAMNLGLSYALRNCREYDFILTLNDDTFFGKDYIFNLVNFAAIKPHALIGSVLLQKEKGSEIIYGGHKQNWITGIRTAAINKGKDLRSLPRDHYEESSGLSGRGTLIPAEVFFKLGLYDNKHLPHHGDVEFSRRAFLDGYGLFVYYGAPVYTYEASQPQKISLKNIPQIFFSIKSSRNIKERFWFCILSTENIFYGIIYFICDLFRVVGGLSIRSLQDTQMWRYLKEKQNNIGRKAKGG